MSRIAFALVLLVASAAPAFAAESDVNLLNSPINRLDNESLQRGARDFVNYCLTCHSAKYMRYNRLADLGLTDAQITGNLMFASKKIGDTMTVAMTPADGKTWFGNAPPDLSVEARIRGSDWLYSYLLGFYRDETTSGWNNLVFPNVAMPNVLWQLSGVNKLVKTDYDEFEKAQAAAIAVKGLVALEPESGGKKYSVSHLELDQPGTMSRAEYEAFVADLVNYLDYMGEPIRNTRVHLGYVVLLFLGVLFVLAYALKRDYWKELH